MSVRSLHLAKAFLQASKCRRADLVRPLAQNVLSGRRCFSQEVPPPASTTPLELSTESSSSNSPSSESIPSDALPTESDLPPKKKRVRGPNKPKATVISGEEELVQTTRKRKPKVVDPETPETVSELKPAKRKYSPRKPKNGEPTAEPKAEKPVSKRKFPIGPRKPQFIHTSKLELPPIEDWRYYFPVIGEVSRRAVIRNPETAKLLAESYVPEGSKDKIIIDANPGPGQLTRALLALPRERIKKIIVLEEFSHYLPYLHSLAEVDPRVVVIPQNPKLWDTYTFMEETGIMDDIKTVGWDRVHPQLHFMMHISGDTSGEQLVAQFLRAVPEHQWLFKYGRVPLHLIIPDRLWTRIIALENDPARCKVSVMCQAAADAQESVPIDLLLPFTDHFHPKGVGALEHSENRFRVPHRAVTFTPLEEQTIKPGDLDFWDYCTRKLFVQKATPLSTSINGLGPGGFNILPDLNSEDLPSHSRLTSGRTPRSLTVEQWGTVVQAFKKWPFRPQQLSIDAFSIQIARLR